MKVDITKFAGQSDLFRYLSANKTEIIDMKKSFFYPNSGCNKHTENAVFESLPREAQKALTTAFDDDPLSGVIKRTIIGNTYNWLDSHNDVHLPGLFAKSIDERKDKIFHLENHHFTISAKVGIPTEIFEKRIDWKDLGIDKAGKTEALFMTSNISKERNPQVFEAYLRGEVDQHSVGMQFVDLDLALNDDEFKEAFSNWNKYISQIGNREEAENQGFFWAIKEAKLREISAVLEGSNELTPTLENKKLGPSAGTLKDGPDNSTQKGRDFIFID